MVTDTFNSKRQPVAALANKFATASLEVIPPQPALEELMILSDDDSDSETNTNPVVQVTGIGKVTKYLSCLNTTCYRKKLQNLRCPKCGITYTDQSAGKSIIGTICAGDTVLTFFTQQAESMVSQLDLGCDPVDNNFTKLLADRLPFPAKVTKQDNKLVNIGVVEN